MPFRNGILLLALLVAGCSPVSPAAPLPTTAPLQPTASLTAPADTPTPAQTADPDAFAFAQNRRLGRAVNLGNALEAPEEGQWGVVLEESFFSTIKAGGFDSIRVPIRWNAHAAEEAPYRIDPIFFARVNWVVKQARQNGLNVILNIHHYDELMEDPQGHRERYLTLWSQIASHYQDEPDSVYFELLNEPYSTLGKTGAWNGLLAEAVAVVRKTNPNRTLIVGPGEWNSLYSLPLLELPEEDRNLIVTFHYYLPFSFTHQGADWVENATPWLGTTWMGTAEELAALNGDFDRVVQWSERYNRPIFMGEFGAYEKADMDSRARWTAAVARAAENRGFSWAYWEFCAGFGVYDRGPQDWVEPLRQALVP